MSPKKDQPLMGGDHLRSPVANFSGSDYDDNSPEYKSKVNFIRNLIGATGLSAKGELNNPLFGMLYGSQKPGRDIDIFLLFGTPVKKNIVRGQFDLNQIEYNDFLFRLNNFDIEYTEPVLTGDYFFGDIEILRRAKQFLDTAKPTEENLDYLGKRALETYLQAKVLYSQGQNELFDKIVNEGENFKDLTAKILNGKFFDISSPIISKALSLLTFTQSYLASRKRYFLGEGNVTLRGILENPETPYDFELRSLMKYFKSTNEELKLEIPEVDQYFKNTKSLLIRSVSN